jgi:hypothetical protein
MTSSEVACERRCRTLSEESRSRTTPLIRRDGIPGGLGLRQMSLMISPIRPGSQSVPLHCGLMPHVRIPTRLTPRSGESLHRDEATVRAAGCGSRDSGDS